MQRPGGRFLLVIALCGLLAGGSAHALDTGRTIAQLAHVWYENQLPQGTVLSITQRQDGSMWAATYGGLVHYSGAGFDTLDLRTSPVLASSSIMAVHADRDGVLWVGTLNGGLYRMRARTLERVDLPREIESVFGIVQDGAGALWLTTNVGIARMLGEQVHVFGTDDGFPPRGFYRAIVADHDGGVWIAVDGVGIVHVRDGAVTTFDTGSGLPTNAIYSLAVDREGTLWAGTQSGPARLRNGRFERDQRLASLDSRRIYSLHGDRDGSLWLAPLGVGICRLAADDFECDNTLAGMVGETVRSMFEDREGNLWMGTTSSGLHRFSDSKLVTVTGPMASNAVRAVHQDRQDTLWIGTDGSGLARYQDRVLVPAADINAKLPGLLVRAIESDAAGGLWVGSTDGVGRIGADGRARSFGIRDGLPGTIVFAFAPARDGGMWVGTLQGVARIVGDTVQVIEASRGDDVRALHEDGNGRLWIGARDGLHCLHAGTLDRCGTNGLAGTSVFAFHPRGDDLWLGTSIGLARIRAGKLAWFTREAGFYGDAVFAILDDDAGGLWISSNRGIARIALDDLDALERGTKATVEPVWYGKDDGMLSQQANGASQTPAARTSDGRLWFGTVHGVVRIDPRHQRSNTLPPPVAVEHMLVDGREVDPDHAGVIGPGIGRIEFRFAGMSYVAPAAVRYRYHLEGFDRGWSDAETARAASYTNLPPGDYAFHVTASNNDGVWNGVGASVAFVVAPQWHETWWFRSLFAFAVTLLLAAVYRVRVWRLHERQRELKHEVAQRTDALRRANAELHRLAELDGLTRIANRGAFDRRLREAWDEHAQSQRALAVLLCDIDAFKAYNDSYGHLAGDAALIEVARTLAHGLRSSEDLAARYGGEEFAVLLSGCDAEEAMAVAARMLDAVRRLDIAHRASGAAACVTISIGVAASVPDARQAPEALLQRADEALYRAKADGRDRVARAVAAG